MNPLFFLPRDRVNTPLGRGFVVKDNRDPGLHPFGYQHDQVWVKLDAGDNPQWFPSQEVSPS